MALDESWWPATADVAALVRSRTRTSGIEGDFQEGSPPPPPLSQLADDFSASSWPTKAMVERIIEMAAVDFRSMAGHRDPCSDGLKKAAAGKVVYLAVLLVQISYPTQGADQQKVTLAAIRDLWDTSSTELAKQIAEHCPPDPDGPDIQAPGTALRPVGRVPGGDPDPCTPYPAQLGLKTRW